MDEFDSIVRVCTYRKLLLVSGACRGIAQEGLTSVGTEEIVGSWRVAFTLYHLSRLIQLSRGYRSHRFMILEGSAFALAIIVVSPTLESDSAEMHYEVR